MVSSTPWPHFTPGKDQVPILQEAGWAPGPVWTGGKSCPYRDSIPDRLAHSQSQYRLNYRAQNFFQYITKKKLPSPSTHVPRRTKRSNSGLQIQTSGILCYVIVYVDLSTDVPKNFISFTYRIKQSLYPGGYSITILRNVWKYLTTHSNIPQDFTRQQHY